MDKQISGLTNQEVMQRKINGQGETQQQPITKTKSQIFKGNILTLFNLLNFTIAALLFAVGAYTNLVFIVIIIANIVIGIAQELKAKKLVDGLSILNRPHISVMRDGKERQIEVDEIVKDDVMILDSGKQICNDATVLSGNLEVNESLLTGESDAVIKKVGDQLLSGSSVISGRCYARVTHVGGENYATKLANEVKKEKQTESELLGSMKKVTKLTSFLILPLGILLFVEAMFLRGSSLDKSVIASSAALLGMLPKGLVLLITVSLAMGVIRLAKMKILVQNIYSLETLAHVDVLCLDKTGTITDGKMKVESVISLNKLTGEKRFSEYESERLIRSYLYASEDNNATFEALKEKFTPKLNYQPTSKISFSSQRKWGAVSFGDIGTLFVGAPERIFKEVPKEANDSMDRGHRVIAVGFSGQTWNNDKQLPENILPLYLITLTDTIRKNTRQTLEYFHKEGVDVKVISGDHVKTVSMIAKKAGLKRWTDCIDLSTLGDSIDFDKICHKYSVFARVTPKQKQELVMALKRQGHHVAMTGDGVNDLLALREADCSIAVAQGSDASRQISQIVLMDSDFTNLPQVVLEGRKVINNVTRTSGVFFIKTIYSVLVSIFCLILNIPFPFIPIQITVIDAAMEAWPSFLTIFESNTSPVSGSFLKKSISNALPFAFVVTSMIMFVSFFSPFTESQNQTIMYMLLILTTSAAVIRSCIPFTKLRAFICTTMIVGTFGGLAILPKLFEVVHITVPMLAYISIVFTMGFVILLLILNFKKMFELQTKTD